jgi:uncharacterized protein (TIGR02145 family)
MKKAIILLVVFCIAAFAQQKDTFIDSRDKKKYKTTKIGKRTWMAENLNFDARDSKCYGNKTSNCDKYGRLYDWYAAKKACPKGWHLPTNAEWDNLVRYADGDEGTESPYDSETAGKFLKAKGGWNNYKGESGNGKDKYGFAALPGGYGNADGNLSGIGNDGFWWSSNADDDRAFGRNMGYDGEFIYYTYYAKSYFFSIRCLKN